MSTTYCSRKKKKRRERERERSSSPRELISLHRTVLRINPKTFSLSCYLDRSTCLHMHMDKVFCLAQQFLFVLASLQYYTEYSQKQHNCNRKRAEQKTWWQMKVSTHKKGSTWCNSSYAVKVAIRWKWCLVQQTIVAVCLIFKKKLLKGDFRFHADVQVLIMYPSDIHGKKRGGKKLSERISS